MKNRKQQNPKKNPATPQSEITFGTIPMETEFKKILKKELKELKFVLSTVIRNIVIPPINTEDMK